MKLGEVLEYYNFTKFHYILMKKIIVLYQTHLADGPSVRGRWIAPYSLDEFEFFIPNLIHINLVIQTQDVYFKDKTNLQHQANKEMQRKDKHVWDFLD